MNCCGLGLETKESRLLGLATALLLPSSPKSCLFHNRYENSFTFDASPESKDYGIYGTMEFMEHGGEQNTVRRQAILVLMFGVCGSIISREKALVQLS